MKILLICNAGSSTGLLADKMKEYNETEGLGHEINAVSVAEGRQIAGDWDILLLGPQVGYAVKQFNELFPNKPAASIPPVMYGTIDGASTVKFAEGLIK